MPDFEEGRRVAPVSARVPLLARHHKALAATGLARLGLHPSQELALMLLWESEPRSQRDLASALGVEAPTVARTLARLEAAGLVARRRSADDARTMEVTLTARGRDLHEPVLAWWAELERLTTAGLTSAEVATLVDLLDRVDRAVCSRAEPVVEEDRGSRLRPGR